MIPRSSGAQLNMARKALVMQGMQASIAARVKAGVDLKTPICIYGLCEANNVTVRFNDINMEGMYDRTPKPRIHLSVLRPLARRTFTCAHELGHHLFGHGSTIDELRDDQNSSSNRPPNEILADAFASFVLMPTLGLKEAFARRGLDPNRATALDMYAIACNFGVGQATLVNHLAYGVNLISQAQRDRLGRITPKMIRTELLGEAVSAQLTVADQNWSSPTLDVEQGMLLLLPSGVVVDVSMLAPERDLAAGRVFRATKCGITRVVIPGTKWATYVRIARRQYIGLAKFRHLEETADD
ncbi:ImmA/IrrE family metallo-endopeptidase [Stenotrophomonas maltophilia]|uniref:ImmA/IrrE family metallo-endopeptidase n=1 Tax=Stenotrophomonas TaxID=40323 RepID=UPI00131012DD|nr:ImmA/IrrE family metallo-endopeptidase [Stenotrophomonas maltophilia]MBA0224535.1 ImmA/IrrE family metallo-endopeptidase [Stenotrophomonas maltophilia]MBA0342543.1 ImmA/IrrE family metallo-endopeptidase [Stenotrophomonas maltophilia]MBA0365778.1 ImmA/IrrE family metallo-endopeptidase [Stenotrophomonas maltophilia]MBA0405119.1 ImmA/IrrE family metallo-endopeptidase [Stenotrophomonas maltophilia]MCF3519867.1 ImmA/IrrE family metallo-endopeptidase [Stenotrophomonas maltophilia]